MDLSPSLFLIIFIVSLAAVVSILFARRRENTWRRFARRHGLTYAKGPRVYGRIGDRPFSLYKAEQSSDTGLLGVEEVTMAVGILGGLPRGIDIHKGGIIGEAEKFLGTEDIEIGDEEFDRHAIASAGDPIELTSYLTHSRKEAILRLLSISSNSLSGLRNSEIFLTEREMLSSISHLEDRFRTLLEIAKKMDG